MVAVQLKVGVIIHSSISSEKKLIRAVFEPRTFDPAQKLPTPVGTLPLASVNPLHIEERLVLTNPSKSQVIGIFSVEIPLTTESL